MAIRTIARALAATLTVVAVASPASAATKSYTLAQVKTHKTSGNCWSVINGNVYNLTKWIPRHEGGSRVIRMLCGIDGTKAFQTSPHVRNGSIDEEVAPVLKAYRIGKLKVTKASPTPSPSATSYTMAQVQTHDSATNCWSAINGKVYNFTDWVNKHPGGSLVITSLCGLDGSAAFTGRHGNQPGPAAALATYFIGSLTA